MVHQSSSVKHPAIKQLFVSRLQAALNLYIADSAIQTPLKSQIPLYRAKDQQRVLYVCAIALQLSPVLNLPAMEIASTLAQLVRSQTDEQDCTIHVVPPGWMHLELTQTYLAAWLQHLIQAPPQLGRQGSRGDSGSPVPKELGIGGRGEQGSRGVIEDTSSPSPPSLSSPSLLTPHTSHLFAVQYSHARCCSLLQLAHQEGLITLKPANSSMSSAVWLAVEPNPIPWLNSEQICLCHSAEQALIAQLIASLDDYYCHCASGQPINWHNAALTLSQTFQTFYSHCRIWGEVKSQNIQLAQARLGLVLIAQSILRFILQDRLNLIAPQVL